MFNFLKKFVGLKDKESCITKDNIKEIAKISAMGNVLSVEDDGRRIKDLILRSIKEAKSSIKIAVAWFSDWDIISALEKQKSRNKDIKIDIIISNEEWNKVEHLGKFNLKIIDRKDSNMMHHKFCIIDNRFVVCGSYNYTRNAINNEEFVVKLEGKDVVKAFNNIFDRLKDK